MCDSHAGIVNLAGSGSSRPLCFECECALRDFRRSTPRCTETEILVNHQFCDREAILHLADVGVMPGDRLCRPAHRPGPQPSLWGLQRAGMALARDSGSECPYPGSFCVFHANFRVVEFDDQVFRGLVVVLSKLGAAHAVGRHTVRNTLHDPRAG